MAESIGFTLPSANTWCILTDTLVLRHRRAGPGASPEAPADCPEFSDYGQGLLLYPTGPARFVCAGDPAMGGAPALRYGRIQAGGGMSATASRRGCGVPTPMVAASASPVGATRYSDRSALLSVSWKGFVRLRCGGLSSCFATSDDLARGARM
ncbi:hypothetical protein [Mycobacterium sp. ITM-2016-00318]|uniref:hypothetical protein n=1 Tax=Mycobacterium sp. ITM-2016-00318 TaxID=2099693 RepID=UPI001E44FBAA|nr:hypothetical protein [Mycobacterium sp. ITM-2016-00318]WNG95008.1 hypothetical protein C6A82_011565 [Mycobacterium sp. ITM-2016-00318]